MKNYEGITYSTYNLTVWHPDVHSRYGEELSYFLIAPESYGTWYKLKIENLIRSLNITGWCIYEVYGFYDILVRTWATPKQRQEFSHEIQTSLASKIESFIVTNIDYLWSEKFQRFPKLPEDILSQYTTEYLCLAQGKEPDLAIQKELLDTGHILKNSILELHENNDALKIFIIIDYQYHSSSQITIQQDIKDYLQNKPDCFSDLTLYSGDGFGRFIIKCKVNTKDIFEISTFTMKICSQFRIIKMRASTIITATPNAFESDHIHFKRLDYQSDILKIIHDLEIDKTYMEDLNKYKLKIIQDKYDILCKKSLIRIFGNIFKPLFKAYIYENEKDIMKELIILHQFEAEFRDFSICMMTDKFGKKWVKDGFEPLAEKLDIVESNISKLTLYDWVSILGKVDKIKDQCITDILGVKWQLTVRSAITFRNKFAHGRITDPLEMWSDIVDFLADLLPIQKIIKDKII